MDNYTPKVDEETSVDVNQVLDIEDLHHAIIGFIQNDYNIAMEDYLKKLGYIPKIELEQAVDEFIKEHKPQVNIFGVCYEYPEDISAGSVSHDLIRLTTESDPNKLVTVNVDQEPTAAASNEPSTAMGQSIFNDYYPWKGMEEYNVIDNKISYKKGDPEFSRKKYDTVVKIPEFYYKIIFDDADESHRKIYYYIADKKTTGFSKHPGSGGGRYIGKYMTSEDLDSTSAKFVHDHETLPKLREFIGRKGPGFLLADIAIRSAVWMLYLLEFCSYDIQKKVGFGFCCPFNQPGLLIGDLTNETQNGITDIMAYHTGRPIASNNAGVSVQYRGIENLYGNREEFVDGIILHQDLTVYICLDPSKYATTTDTTDYTAVSQKLTPEILTGRPDGYIEDFWHLEDFPWLMVPKSANWRNTQDTAVIPDKLSLSSFYFQDWTSHPDRLYHAMTLGGNSGSMDAGGIFYIGEEFYTQNSNFIGSRLMFVNAEENGGNSYYRGDYKDFTGTSLAVYCGSYVSQVVVTATDDNGHTYTSNTNVPYANFRIFDIPVAGTYRIYSEVSGATSCIKTVDIPGTKGTYRLTSTSFLDVWVQDDYGSPGQIKSGDIVKFALDNDSYSVSVTATTSYVDIFLSKVGTYTVTITRSGSVIFTGSIECPRFTQYSYEIIIEQT